MSRAASGLPAGRQTKPPPCTPRTRPRPPLSLPRWAASACCSNGKLSPAPPLACPPDSCPGERAWPGLSRTARRALANSLLRRATHPEPRTRQLRLLRPPVLCPARTRLVSAERADGRTGPAHPRPSRGRQTAGQEDFSTRVRRARSSLGILGNGCVRRSAPPFPAPLDAFSGERALEISSRDDPKSCQSHRGLGRHPRTTILPLCVFGGGTLPCPPKRKPTAPLQH